MKVIYRDQPPGGSIVRRNNSQQGHPRSVSRCEIQSSEWQTFQLDMALFQSVGLQKRTSLSCHELSKGIHSHDKSLYITAAIECFQEIMLG